MSENFIIAQIIGIIALIFLAISLKNNNKKKLLKYQMFSSLSYALQYVFLGAYTGCLMNLACVFRNYIFNKYDNKKIPLYWLIIIIAIMIILSIITYNGPISLLPTIGVILFSTSLWYGKLKYIRLAEFISSCLVIFYNIKVVAITGLIVTIVEIITVSISIYRFDIKNVKIHNLINMT